MDAKRPSAAESTLTLDSAKGLLQRLDELAATEQQHGRVGVELVYQAGKLVLIEHYTRFTTK